MPQKGSSEGYVFFNKQRKRWNAQYSDYNAETGEIKKKTKSFKTEDEAKKYLKTIMYQKENPLFIEHHGIPICEILKSNAKLKLDTNQITEAQFTRISDTIKKLENIPIGKKNIDQITSDEIQIYLNSIIHLSNSSIKKVYQQFNQAFKISMNKGYILTNPMSNVIKPKSLKEDRDVRALTVDEQQDFSHWLIHQEVQNCKYRNIFLIQMYMGLRIGEVLALTTHDVDLKHKKVNIHRTLTTNKNRNVVMGNKTKTYSGKRILPISEFLLPYFIEQMQIADAQENNEEKLLFKPKRNKYTTRKNVNENLKKIFLENWNITDITTHNLRHTYGTRCIESRHGSRCRSTIDGT